MNETRIDDRYSFTVETCFDSDDWVWTLLCDGQNLCDGYEATKEEATAKVRQAFKNHMHWVNEGGWGDE